MCVREKTKSTLYLRSHSLVALSNALLSSHPVGETRHTEQINDPATSRPTSPTQPIASTSSPRILRSPRVRSSLPANHKTTACEGDHIDGPALTARSAGLQGQSEPSPQARLRDEGSRDGRRTSKRPLSQSSPVGLQLPPQILCLSQPQRTANGSRTHT